MAGRLRVALLLLAVAAGGALALVGAAPEAYPTVAQVVARPDAYDDVHVKGTIVEGSLQRDATPVRFLMADGAHALEVRWDPAQPLPDHEAGGSIEGKNVVVGGRLVRDSEATYLLATEMTVGCASKYRPAE